MKTGVTLINTSRGGLINTADMIEALKSKQVAYLGIDVYEQEEKLFFRDLSGSIIDDCLLRQYGGRPFGAYRAKRYGNHWATFRLQ